MSDDALTEAPHVQFYIPATSSLLERRPRTLKHGDTFAVFDHYGDIVDGDGSPEGLYHNDTRYLSRSTLLIDGRRPLLLSSTVQDNNAMLSADLTNPDLFVDGRRTLARNMIHIVRSKFLWRGACHERIGLRSYDRLTEQVTLTLRFAADFADLFEIRGQPRRQRGEASIERNRDQVRLRYRGLDGIERATVIVFDPIPDALDDEAAHFKLDIKSGAHASVFVSISCAESAPAREARQPRYFRCLRRARGELRASSERAATIETSNDVVNEILCRSMADLYMLLTDTEYGAYPYAGIPWFCTAFGRDALITAIEMLAIDPDIAGGVLRFLAAQQADADEEEAEAEPGKILHEMRRGEMARLGEVPFARYYGAIDSTPLFVALAGLYLARTGDLDTISALWPHIDAALRWIDDRGDRDGDGFVEYERRGRTGLVNQGWKDSHDSVFHADGREAAGPIALAEVQGYVYLARIEAARIATAMGYAARAASLRAQAEGLRTNFESAFWCEQTGSYALALDGDKKPCQVRASNAGQVLFSGIASPARARRVADQLVRREFFSGWGVRTIATGEARYNPMSYHNGSVWPHDNAMIALGLARYGLDEPIEQILTGIFDAAAYMDLRRLPELYCGFARAPRKGPTSYPVACSPQAWSAAAPFALLCASLGLEIDHRGKELRLHRPRLPAFIDEACIRSLRIAGGIVDLVLRRHGNSVTADVGRNNAKVRVHVIL